MKDLLELTSATKLDILEQGKECIVRPEMERQLRLLQPFFAHSYQVPRWKRSPPKERTNRGSTREKTE